VGAGSAREGDYQYYAVPNGFTRELDTLGLAYLTCHLKGMSMLESTVLGAVVQALTKALLITTSDAKLAGT